MTASARPARSPAATRADDRLLAAQEHARRVRPRVGGFPYLAEALRQAGVRHHRFDVVSTTGVYVFDDDVVVQPGRLQAGATFTVARYDESALIEAIRADQDGRSTFPEFCAATLGAGVLSFRVDLARRTCTYRGAAGQTYTERYPAVTLPA